MTEENEMPPNDILIRLTKTDDGRYVREVLLAVNDDSMIPEMERTAEFIGKCLVIFDRSDAGTEYPEALRYAEGLARPNPRIKLLNS